jgi:hypothetical protein
VFKQFTGKAYAENQSERKIKILRDDKGGEYMSNAFLNFTTQCGIERQAQLDDEVDDDIKDAEMGYEIALSTVSNAEPLSYAEEGDARCTRVYGLHPVLFRCLYLCVCQGRHSSHLACLCG